MEKQMNKISLENVKNAYRKLKASIYYDKTQTVFRDKIVDFENSQNELDRKLEQLHKILQFNIDEDEWEKYKNQRLRSISVLTFPKQVDTKNSGNFITNVLKDEVHIEKEQFFFDSDVETQILGSLWTLSVGAGIDKSLEDSSYGNRLKNANKSLYLFKPYFQQYEAWRDYSLKNAEDLMDRGKDALIIMLDIKNFFYSVNIDQKDFDSFIEKKADKTIKRLNDFVYQSIEEYSKKFANRYEERNFLPIGFLPSNVLSNWCLDKFDKTIINKHNPQYYGRYVDDIIIVEKVENRNIILDIMKGDEKDEEKNDKIVKKYLCEEVSILREHGQDDCQNCGYNEECEYSNNAKPRTCYYINPDLVQNSKTYLIIQNRKLKIFYLRSDGPKALIECFRKEIKKNKSEFRLLPQEQDYLENGLEELFKFVYEEDFFSIDYSDTINKLRSVNTIVIDKFEFSKYLGKNLQMESMMEDKNNFSKIITRIFDNSITIQNYILWERIIQIYTVNHQYEGLAEFVNKVLASIEAIEEKKKKSSNKTKDFLSVKGSLKSVLISGLSRALSIVWNQDVNSVLDKIKKQSENLIDQETINEKRIRYLKTRMYNKNILPTILDAFYGKIFSNDSDLKKTIDNFNKCKYDFTNLMTAISILEKEEPNTPLEIENEIFKEVSYRYTPYFITPQDIAYAHLIFRIANKKMINSGSEKVLHSITKIYLNTNNYNSGGTFDEIVTYGLEKQKSKRKIAVTHLKGESKNVFKIAIANAILKEEYFENALLDMPNRTRKRYLQLGAIVNQAITNKVDILVMPESYVPLEWIPLLARQCAKTDLAIITGIEHIKVGEDVFNLTATILPYKKDFQQAITFFHLKTIYAYDEEKVINCRDLKAQKGNQYDLFVWKGLWFSTYCCMEIASIKDRSVFISLLDMLNVVEWNKDVNYFSNIIESLSRDMHCYCVQVNSADYGDSRIIQPSKTEIKNIIRTKGGTNYTVLVGEINLEKMRKFQSKGYVCQKEDDSFKPTPPDYLHDISVLKLNGLDVEKIIAVWENNM
jgi:hypothetical protein